MAADLVLCPNCLERGSLPRKRNFFHMPTYACPACGQGFSYPFSWITWFVCLLLALGAIVLLFRIVRTEGFAAAIAVGTARWMGVLLVGSVGALFLNGRAKRRVAEAEARAADGGVPAAGHPASHAPSE